MARRLASLRVDSLKTARIGIVVAIPLLCAVGGAHVINHNRWQAQYNVLSGIREAVAAGSLRSVAVHTESGFILKRWMPQNIRTCARLYNPSNHVTGQVINPSNSNNSEEETLSWDSTVYELRDYLLNWKICPKHEGLAHLDWQVVHVRGPPIRCLAIDDALQHAASIPPHKKLRQQAIYQNSNPSRHVQGHARNQVWSLRDSSESFDWHSRASRA